MELTAGQLVLFAGYYKPANFYRCDGQVLSVTDYKTGELAKLLGSRFGGNGTTTVGLPNMPAIPTVNGDALQWLIAADGISYRDGIASALGEVRPLVMPPPADSTLARQWLPCDGRLIPIEPNQALFSLIGTMYGGDGLTQMGLPNIAPIVTAGGQVLNYYICCQGVFPSPECDAVNGSPNSNTYEFLLGSVSQFAISQFAANGLCGFILCQGQSLPLNRWTTLFSVLGTRFGKTPSSQFGVPSIPTGTDGMKYALVTGGVYPAFDN